MYKFLLIEDNKGDSDAFLDTVKRLNKEAEETRYTLTVAETYEKGIEMITDNINGVIVDINLADEYNGNDIIKYIIQKYRIPVTIFTGTPFEQQNDSPIMVHIKGEVRHEEILNELSAVSDTGLFNVIGGTGIIEDYMTKIFWNNLYPQITTWMKKKAAGFDTEKILLRYVVSHIQEFIDEEVPHYATEEMYIKPPVSNKISTGTIFKLSEDENYGIVLSPPCDLAIHNGKFKTDRILVCEIENHDALSATFIAKATREKAKKAEIGELIKNRKGEYYHWLPQNNLFEGGYINFRKIITYSPEKLSEIYNNSSVKVKVQAYFVKNILNRFSSYYARQGQPDFKFDLEADAIVKKIASSVEGPKGTKLESNDS